MIFYTHPHTHLHYKQNINVIVIYGPRVCFNIRQGDLWLYSLSSSLQSPTPDPICDYTPISISGNWLTKCLSCNCEIQDTNLYGYIVFFKCLLVPSFPHTSLLNLWHKIQLHTRSRKEETPASLHHMSSWKYNTMCRISDLGIKGRNWCMSSKWFS